MLQGGKRVKEKADWGRGRERERRTKREKDERSTGKKDTPGQQELISDQTYQ